MDIERMKKLAGLNEAKEDGNEPLEKSDSGKKSAVDDIKNGTLKGGTKHDTESHDVVQDERGNVKVSNEKTIEKKDGEPAKVTQPGKLKLKEAVDAIKAAAQKRHSQHAAAKDLVDKESKDLTFSSYGAWAAAVKSRRGTIDGDQESATAHVGDDRIGDWDADDGGIIHRV